MYGTSQKAKNMVIKNDPKKQAKDEVKKAKEYKDYLLLMAKREREAREKARKKAGKK